jgi:cysteine desulfurase
MISYPIYLDYNATTPCDERVVAFMLPYFSSRFGNAASKTHAYGWAAEEAVEIARENIALLIGSDPSEIIFTSGATESVNLGLKGVYERYASKGNHIITCVTEHKAVLDTCRHIEKNGGQVTYLPVDHFGRIDPGQLKEAIREETILIAIMYANNETGTIQPIREIGEIARSRGVLFFCDATQAAGKMPINVDKDAIDLLALNAHKIYGPKGVGALYIRRRNPRVTLIAQMDGGGHERNMRSGTLNVPAIAGFGKAVAICMEEMHDDATRLSSYRDKIQTSLLELPNSKVNGHPQFRMPHVTNMSFGYVEGQALMLGFAGELALSSGSACTSANLEPSYVLKAMNVSDEMALGSLRISLGRFTTAEEVTEAIAIIKKSLTKARGAM